LVDAPVTLEVSGLEPGEKVQLRAQAIDADAFHWMSTTTLRADDDGRAGLGDHPMRFFELMSTSNRRASFFLPLPSVKIRLSVRRGSTTIATRTLTRTTLAAGVERRPMTRDDADFVGTHFTPAGGGKHPAVLFFGGSEGGDATTDIAALLASHGVEVLTLAYFGEQGLPRELKRIPLEYVRHAYEWLQQQPGVDPERVAVGGISRGGELALLFATTYRDPDRAVALVPSAFVFPSDVNRHVPAWTVRGRDVAFGQTERIPVEEFDGPILAVGAGDDFSWISSQFVKEIEAHRDGHDDDAMLIYEKAGHLVGSSIPYIPLGEHGEFGGFPDVDADARADLWPKLVHFLGGR
jgi:dienelactone hydrolase